MDNRNKGEGTDRKINQIKIEYNCKIKIINQCYTKIRIFFNKPRRLVTNLRGRNGPVTLLTRQRGSLWDLGTGR